MTSLNTRTGRDANKQTGSNLTGEIRQVHRREVFRGSGSRATAAAHPSSGKVKGTTTSSSSSSGSTSTTSSSSPPSPSAPSSASATLAPRGGNRQHVVSDNTELLTTESPDESAMRDHFYKSYDPMTGIRIASTLGGFFLIVLLTLLYKSKCKGKHSREASLNSLAYPSIHPGHLMMRGRNIQVNGGRDFGGGGGGSGCGGSDSRRGGGGGSSGGGDGDPSPAHPLPLTLLDSTCYGYMNQVHPANSHQPIYSNYYAGTTEGQMRSPAVLLITAANSESSDEELSIVSATDHHPREAHRSEQEVSMMMMKRGRNPLGPVGPCRQVLCTSDSQSQCYLHPKSKSPPFGVSAKGNIDINVILPTPSISPSGSENFNMREVGAGSVITTTAATTFVRDKLGLLTGEAQKRLMLASRSLSSENDNDQSEVSSVGGELSESSDPHQQHHQQMLPFGCVNSSLFSLENLKYVDDTSSENIPTRGSDPEEPDQDTRSIGSDSVFACFEHNFDHIAPTYARRVSSISGTSSAALGAISPQPFHRQYSIFAPPPPPPPPVLSPTVGGASNNNNNPELVSSRGGVAGGLPASPSGFGESVEDAELRLTLTQAQVHHRDSFCSDLESVNDYMETGARRRSSSTQTTLSDLRQALGYSPTMGWSGGGGTSPASTSLAGYPFQESNPRRLSVPRRRRSLSPHVNPATTTATTTTTPASVSATGGGGGSGGLISGNQQHHHLISPIPIPTSNSTLPFLSVTLHPTPPPTLFITTSGDMGSSRDVNVSSVGTGTELASTDTPTPTNPYPPPILPATVGTASIVTPTPASATAATTTTTTSPLRMMRKRSFEAVRKTLSLQCEEKADAGNLYLTSSNETTPTN